MSKEKLIYYSVNGCCFLVMLFLLLVFCNTNNIVAAYISGLGVKFWLIILTPVLFILLNLLEKLSIKNNWEDHFVFINDLFKLLSFILFITVIIMGIQNILDGLAVFSLKLIFVVNLGCSVFNIYYIINGKDK